MWPARAGRIIARQSGGVSNMLKIGIRLPSSGIPTLHVTQKKSGIPNVALEAISLGSCYGTETLLRP
jgi:hypothetical protein